MPIYEYKCPKCGLVVEHFQHSYKPQRLTCIGESDIVAHPMYEMRLIQSVPAKRNPEHGLQK